MYYNIKENKILTRDALKLLLNSAIAKTDTNPADDWYMLIDEKPQIDEYTYCEKMDIIFDNEQNVYIQQYVIKDKSLEEIKQSKINELKNIYNDIKQHLFLRSSLGFDINANEQAKIDIMNIISIMEYKNLNVHSFRDYDNNTHENLSKNDFNTMLSEIALSSEYVYNQKWQYEQTINNASNILELKSMVIKINFYGVDNDNI